ncbi:MAG: alkaline phosphatase family protein [Sphingomonas bacterium]|nr:alkaline phosphatase family protein [Sphingomonas bacterium]
MRYLFAAVAAVIATPAFAQPPRLPKLIVAISVDQFSADLFDEYRGLFSGGLARLAGGAAFRNGYQGHAATETCPGHSTIVTGSRPSRTGIIANAWFDLGQARSDKAVYCAEDERVPGSSSSSYTVSPLHLKVPTLGELMTAADPASRTVAVAGKDRGAVMMGGQRPAQRWYWDGKKFATDLKAVTPVPVSVAAANQAVAALIAAPAMPLEAPAYCNAKSRVVAIGDGKTAVGGGRFARAAGDASGFRASPAFDGMTLALAAKLIDELALGKRRATDLIAIGLSATDYVGHTYGTGGAEMCLQLLSLDRDLGDFLRLLDARRIDYAVVLTADHGGEDIPERLRLLGVTEAARSMASLEPAALGKRLAAELKLSGPVLIGSGANGDVYLDRALRPADRTRAINAALAAYRADPQVEAVFTRDQLARIAAPVTTPDRWTLAERARASFDVQRSGDLVVLLKRHITPIAKPGKGYAATHGSAWDYDRRVPILMWRPGMTNRPSDAAVETIDIMPTLAAMIGLRVDPRSIDGHCLPGVAGATCPPR